jgi:predicted GNAT family acetyltransferase
MITESPTLNEYQVTAISPLPMRQPVVTTRLRDENEAEVLGFLADRALHNAVMTGLIRGNGIESKFNRGTFYGCRDVADTLLGVALIGHAVFIDARCDEALREFARLAQEFPRVHMLVGEQEMIERFWKYYAPNGQPRHRLCREVLFELNDQSTRSDHVANLRLARVSDLSSIVPVHATMAFEESGVNPLLVDPDGFRQRCRRRIEERRTWVLIEEDKLIFKADIISDTPEVVYLEGVYVHPEYRRQGHGSKCLTQLTRGLLNQTRSISLLVNQERQQAMEFFKKLGFVSRGLYDTIFLRTQTELL